MPTRKVKFEMHIESSSELFREMPELEITRIIRQAAWKIERRVFDFDLKDEEGEICGHARLDIKDLL